MKASLRWLKTMVDVPNDLKSFTEQLDLTGTAVDSVDSVGKSLDGVYVGQIVSKEQVPSSDHLWITLVDVGGQNLSPGGQPEPLQIVCGAQNFNTGDKTAVALIGTTLPNGTQINKTKLRGVESFGMNCSAQELGLGDDHEGILVLPEDAPIGIPFAEYMQLNDVVLDLEITPNRPDCMSMLGVAREIAAVYDTSYNLPGISDLLEGQASIKTLDSSEDIDKLVSVSIDDADRCTRYTARLIKGVKVGPSPDWLVERINAAGARSINNIVDITNYIMFEVGQPLHAFDYDCLQKDAEGKVHIRVRAAREHEAFTSLDAVERVLDPDVSCIVDANAGGEDGKTIALAGVMGGLTSEVTEDTVNILLESASFSTTHTSRTSRRLKLVSESSTRFERGVDDATCNDFSDRAAQLMAVLAGGEIVPGVIDVYLKPRDIPQLVFRVGRFGKFVGQDIPADEVASILKRLGCLVEQGTDTMTLAVTPPSFRPDLLREIDLYEEVLRVWGMNRVTPTLPGGRDRIGKINESQLRERQISSLLRAMGINETMTYAFVPKSDGDDVPMQFSDQEDSVEVINPMSVEMSVLRRSILPGLLRSVAYNLNHGTPDIMLFEMGNIFFTGEGRKLPRERQSLCVVMAGSKSQPGWNSKQTPVDFFDAKGLIETLAYELNVAKLRFKEGDPTELLWLQAGRSASVLAGSSVLGWLGEVHPKVTKAFEIDVPVIAFEIEYPLLIKASSMFRDYVDIPLFPAVSRDLAVVVDSSVAAEKVSQVIQSAVTKLLADVLLFDVFEDQEKIGTGKKSLAFSLSYQALDRTLTADEVEVLHQKVIKKVQSALGGEIRT